MKLDLSFLWKKRDLTEPSLPKEREFGVQAERLVKDPAFQRAIMSVRESIHTKWATSPVMDREGQHELRLLLKLLDDLEGNIKQEMDSGILATEQMKREKVSNIRR